MLIRLVPRVPLAALQAAPLTTWVLLRIAWQAFFVYKKGRGYLSRDGRRNDFHPCFTKGPGLNHALDKSPRPLILLRLRQVLKVIYYPLFTPVVMPHIVRGDILVVK